MSVMGKAGAKSGRLVTDLLRECKKKAPMVDDSVKATDRIKKPKEPTVEDAAERAGEEVGQDISDSVEKSTRFLKGAGVLGGLGSAGLMAAHSKDDEPEEEIPEAAPEEKEDKKAKQEVAQTVADTQKAEKPKDIDALFQKAAKLANWVPEKQDRTDWEAKLNEAKEAWEAREAQIEDRETMETMVHALTQLIGAAYGMRTGLNVSGIPFRKRDWEKKMDRNLSRWREESGQIKDMRAAEEAQLADERRAQTAARGDRLKVALAELRDARRAQEGEEKREHERDLFGTKKGSKDADKAAKGAAKKDEAEAEASSAMALVTSGGREFREKNYRTARDKLAGHYSSQVLRGIDDFVLDEDLDVDADRARVVRDNMPVFLQAQSILHSPASSPADKKKAKMVINRLRMQADG